jgi:protein involved in polysaccharide export with SLBB domain
MTMRALLRFRLLDQGRAVLCALGLTALSIAAATEVQAQVPGEEVQAQVQGEKVPPTTNHPVGDVRPGDEIHLQIWREPELSGDFQVDETGVVVFPKIGPMRVTRAQPAALSAQLVRAYSAYLVNPSIQVQVRRRINVLGAVRNPGLYEVDPTITVADAISLAGGVTPAARANQVELRRRGATISGQLSGRELIGDSPIHSGDQLFVPQRGWISRNPGVMIGVLGLVSTAIWRFAK